MAEIIVKYSTGEIIFKGEESDYYLSKEFNDLIVINEVTVKGYFPQSFRDSAISRGYVDISTKLNSGKILLKSSQKEFDDFYEKCLCGSDRYFKVIGLNTYKNGEFKETGKLIFKANSTGKIPNVLFCN